MHMPRVKPEHVPYRLPDGTIRVGGRVFGIATEINDPDGWVWALMQAADGSRNVDAIVAEVRGTYPDVADATLRSGLQQLAGAGHLEDAASATPLRFSARERERYQRSVQFYRWVDPGTRPNPWDVQWSLRDARIVQIGLGGTGGVVAAALVASGVGHLHCVEPDVVELSNLNRQTLFTEDDVGKPKVEAGIARLSRLNSDVTVTGKQLRVESEGDCAKVIDGYDLLVLAADQPLGIRSFANRACLAAGVPWVDGGYHGALVTTTGYIPGVGACEECASAKERDRLQQAELAGRDVADMAIRPPGHPVTAVSAGLGGHLIAYVAVAMLTGVLPFSPGTRLGINLVAPGERVFEESPRRPDCPACANIPPTTRLPHRSKTTI